MNNDIKSGDGLDCTHDGSYGTLAQSVFFTGDQLLIICTQNCMRCGKLLTNINPVQLSVKQSLLTSMGPLPNLKA